MCLVRRVRQGRRPDFAEEGRERSEAKLLLRVENFLSMPRYRDLGSAGKSWPKNAAGRAHSACPAKSAGHIDKETKNPGIWSFSRTYRHPRCRGGPERETRSFKDRLKWVWGQNGVEKLQKRTERGTSSRQMTPSFRGNFLDKGVFFEVMDLQRLILEVLCLTDPFMTTFSTPFSAIV